MRWVSNIPGELAAWADSDWAGDKTTRKSTSGGILAVADSMIKSWSSTQATRALSVGEAEYYAVIKAAAEAIGLQSIAREFGWEFKVIIRSDSSTAKCISSRQGLGKLRHIQTQSLWIQQHVRDKKILLHNVLVKSIQPTFSQNICYPVTVLTV